MKTFYMILIFILPLQLNDYCKDIINIKHTIVKKNTIPKNNIKPIKLFKVTATVYNPYPSQYRSGICQTADQSKIKINDIKKVKWCALSRNLLKRWGGHFNYGDTIKVFAKDHTIIGLWIVHDTMNKRFTNYIDLLQLKTSEGGFIGKWKNVYIVKM